MRNIFLLIGLLFIISCGYTENQRDTSDADATSEDHEVTNEKLDEISLTYYDTIDVHGTDIVIIPIGGDKEKWNRRKSNSLRMDGKLQFGYDRDYYKDNYNRYFNLLFYNVKQDSSYLLFKQERVVINQLIANKNDSGESASRFIFYDIRDKDYNLDGKLNYKDSNHLFVSNKDGSDLLQLTPNNSQLLDWTIVKKSNIIIAKVVMDNNDDKKFDLSKDGDDIKLIKIDLDKKRKGKLLLDKAIEEQLKNQFLDLIVKTN